MAMRLGISKSLAPYAEGIDVVMPPVNCRYDITIVLADDWTELYGHAFRQVNPVVVKTIAEGVALIAKYEALNEQYGEKPAVRPDPSDSFKPRGDND